MTAKMRRTWINGRWPLMLPEHRASRPAWPWWEATRLAAMRPHIHERTVVYDIGAEEGDLPALWASWGARVAMFEPNERVWPNIAAIWAANHLRDPLLTFPGFAAADDHDHHSHMTGWPPSTDGPVIGDHGFLNLSERPDVPRVRIDTAAEHIPPPSVVTIDVEGAELEVLKGATWTLADARPQVFVSIHPEFMADMYGTHPDELHKLMGEVGYGSTFLAIDHEHHWWFWPHEHDPGL